LVSRAHPVTAIETIMEPSIGKLKIFRILS